MNNSVVSFFLHYKSIIIFYLVVIGLLIWKRKKIQTQAKIIFLYRMKWGLKWMDKYSQKFREWIILLGYIGVGGGFIGLIFISFILIKNLFDLFAKPAATSGVSLVLPGLNVPGLGILPFWDWIIAIFLIAIIHEFAHGIVARAHNVKVKNTGIVLFGPIIGAFVEPDEQNLRKQKDITQYSILAAGAFSNVLMAIMAILLLSFVFTPIQQDMELPNGFTFASYYGEDFPFQQANIVPGTVITGLDGEATKNFQEFSELLAYTKPGQEIVINTKDKDYQVTLTENPENSRKSFLGIQTISNEVNVKYEQGIGFLIYQTIARLSVFLRWLFLLSLGIGLFNLLPLPIVDGGRMAQVFLHKLKGKEKGEKRYRQISLFFLFILLLNLLFPFLSKLF